MPRWRWATKFAPTHKTPLSLVGALAGHHEPLNVSVDPSC